MIGNTILCLLALGIPASWAHFYRMLIQDEEGPAHAKPVDALLLAGFPALIWPISIPLERFSR